MKAVLTHPIGDYAVQPKDVSGIAFLIRAFIVHYLTMHSIIFRLHGQLMELQRLTT